MGKIIFDCGDQAAAYRFIIADSLSEGNWCIMRRIRPGNSFNLQSLVVSGSYSGASPNEIVTVTVSANKQWWILGSLPRFTNPTTLTAQTAMIVEGPS